MTMNNKSWKITGLIATLVIVLTIPLSLIMNRHSGFTQQPVAVFTGGKACIECHQKEYRLWKGSDHDNAMSVASDNTVLGDFNNAEFIRGMIELLFCFQSKNTFKCFSNPDIFVSINCYKINFSFINQLKIFIFKSGNVISIIFKDSLCCCEPYIILIIKDYIMGKA